MKKLVVGAGLALLLVGASATTVFAEGHEEAPEAKSLEQTLIDARAGSVVSVKLVLNVRLSLKADPSRSQDIEQNRTGHGVIVDKSGLILVPNSLSKFVIPNPQMRDQVNVSSSPNNVRVTFPGDETEYPAILGAQDSTLGVAFLLIKDLKGKELTPVDMNNAATPAIGDHLYGVSRLDEGFDHAPMCDKTRIIGKVSKPRDMWIINGAGNFLGQPVYTKDNQVAGLVISQEGVGENVSRRNFLLPLGIAKAKIRQAKRQSEDELERILEEEAAAAEAAAAGEGEKKDGEGGDAKEGDAKDGASKDGDTKDGDAEKKAPDAPEKEGDK